MDGKKYFRNGDPDQWIDEKLWELCGSYNIYNIKLIIPTSWPGTLGDEKHVYIC